MTPVRLEPTALRSRVKHSTTEPLRSLITAEAVVIVIIYKPNVCSKDDHRLTLLTLYSIIMTFEAFEISRI